MTPEIRPEKIWHTELKGTDACIFSSFSLEYYVSRKQDTQGLPCQISPNYLSTEKASPISEWRKQNQSG